MLDNTGYCQIHQLVGLGLERTVSMNYSYRILAAIVVICAIAIGGCSSDTGTGEHSRGEHDRDLEGHGKEGEESGTELSLTEKYDKVRRGARLVLAYDAGSNSFTGTVENTTKKTLKRVRVEVHLSNGKELGPTQAADLGPGQKRAITLKATTKDFKGWTAHPEVGSGEHGHGEGRGEHDREGKGEHKENRE